MGHLSLGSYLDVAQQQFQLSIWSPPSWRSLHPVTLRKECNSFSYPFPLGRIFQTPLLLMLSLSEFFCMIFLTIWMPEMDISWLRPKAYLDLDRAEVNFIVLLSWKSLQRGNQYEYWTHVVQLLQSYIQRCMFRTA